MYLKKTNNALNKYYVCMSLHERYLGRGKLKLATKWLLKAIEHLMEV
jgi:hypothetical protein